MGKRIDFLQKEIDEMRKDLALLDNKDITKLRIKEIVDVIEHYHGIPEGSIYEQSQKRKIVDARRTAMAIMYYTMKISTTNVGAIFNRNHSSVSQAVTQIGNLCANDSKARTVFLSICNDLKISKEVIDRILTNTE